MYELPVEISIGDRIYHIRNKGDYRVILDCFSALNDENLPEKFRVLTALIIFYEDFDCVEGVMEDSNTDNLIAEMYKFFQCGEQENQSNTNNQSLIDWEQDSQLICSAINGVAQKEIRLEPYIHWWSFMGYYLNVKESLLSEVIHIRYKLLHSEKLDKAEQKFKQNNPQYFVWKHTTVTQREDEAWLRKQWKVGE